MTKCNLWYKLIGELRYLNSPIFIKECGIKMGLPTNINTLLKGNVVEWARIEFKASWKPEESLKTICAFANDIDNWGGGYILIGIEEDNGRPILPVKGIPTNKVDDIMKDLLNKCNMITPHYLPVVAPVEYQNKMLIVIWAAGGDVRPYSSPTDFIYEKGKAKPTKEKTFFIRKMSSTVKPSHDELNELYSLSNKIPFDDRINHDAEVSNLNINLIRQYLTNVNSGMIKDFDSRTLLEICKDMGIASNMPEYQKPKNVGLLFFSDEPDKFFPYAQIDVVAFPNGLGGDVIDEQTFKGPIDQQLRDALRYIKNSYIKRKIIKHPDRAEADHIYNYPYAAIEEALANAVYHKAYDEREPIEVRIDDEKIEILSFPGPVRSVTKEQLRSYKVTNRRYRNRRIGEFLKELHLTEGRNTGFKKILDAVSENGSPMPEFETDDEHSYFISRIFIHEGFKKENEPDNSENEVLNSKNEPDNSKNEVLNSENEVLNLRNEVLRKIEKYYNNTTRKKAEEIIIAIYNNEYITITQIAEKTKIPKSTVDRYISELKNKGFLKREGTKKDGKWIITIKTLGEK